MNNKVLAGMLCAGLVLSAPFSALAADGVHLEKPKVGAQQIKVRFDNGEKGDWYHLYVDDYFIGGRLVNSEVAASAKVFELPENVSVKNNSALRIEMAGKGNCYLADELKMPGAAPSQTIGNALRATYPKTLRPGESVRPHIIVADDSGREQDVSASAIYSYDGPIVSGSFVNGGFRVSPDAKEGDSIGVVIILGNERVDVQMPIKSSAPTPTPTPPPAAIQKGLNLSLQNGPINQETEVKVKLDGPVSNAVSVRVLVRYKDNPQAMISAKVINPALLLAGGETTLQLKSTAAGGASFSILALDAAGRQVQDLPFGFYFGDNPMSKDQVRMTIGLQTLRVGSAFRVIDTAPFIDAGRTFVPLRALAEAFGAEVNYHDHDQSIQIKQGDREVKMKIGDKAYRVNGAVQEIDTAPYLSNRGRTIVPVRFAAEGLGYQLDVFYDAQGLTNHIIFKK